MCSLSVKVLSNYLHLQAHCDKLKAFRIAQFFQNSKIQKITVKKIFFQNFDTGFLLIGVFRVYSRSFIAKLAKTKKSISSETNPTNTSLEPTFIFKKNQTLILLYYAPRDVARSYMKRRQHFPPKKESELKKIWISNFQFYFHVVRNY